MTKNTKEFTNNIKNSDVSAISFLNNNDAITYLEELIKNSNMTKASLLKAINHDINNGYKYLDGTRSMNREFLLKVIITLKLDINVANRLLKLFSHSELYVKRKRDYLIITGIINGFDIEQINNILNTHEDCDLLI